MNFGAVVTDPPLNMRAPHPRPSRARTRPIHPWLLGSLDENNVQGYGGTPINMNGYMPDFIFNIGATGAVLPAPGRYYIAVDSGRNPFTGRPLARQVRAPLVDQRRHAADGQGDHDAARHGQAEHRRAR